MGKTDGIDIQARGLVAANLLLCLSLIHFCGEIGTRRWRRWRPTTHFVQSHTHACTLFSCLTSRVSHSPTHLARCTCENAFLISRGERERDETTMPRVSGVRTHRSHTSYTKSTGQRDCCRAGLTTNEPVQALHMLVSACSLFG